MTNRGEYFGDVGSEAQKEKYLTPAASGDMIFSYALTEPRTGSDAKNIEAKVNSSVAAGII